MDDYEGIVVAVLNAERTSLIREVESLQTQPDWHDPFNEGWRRAINAVLAIIERRNVYRTRFAHPAQWGGRDTDSLE